MPAKEKSSGSHPAFADRVQVLERRSGTYLVLPVATPDIVSFQGSFLNIPDFASGEGLIRDLTVSMLDKGTKKRDKNELAEALEGLGAQLSFSADGVRVRVSGRALRKDLATVLGILGEILHDAKLPEEEFQFLKARYEAGLRRSLTTTSTAAAGALSRRLYSPNHANYSPDPRTEMERLGGVEVGDLHRFYDSSLRPLDWRLSIVGDVDWEDIADVVDAAFPDGKKDGRSEAPAWSGTNVEPGREELFIADRENIDVRIGHALDLTSVDPAYLPLYVGNYVLGGNFSARLMNVIRDQMGLTYGIHASLADVDALHNGMWSISVTLSLANLERGISETMKLLNEFVAGGISEEELSEKKTTITGSFKVGMSSTASIAGAVLRNAEKGRDVGYLDRFPVLVNDLQLPVVNSVIAEHLDPERSHIVLAGSVPSVS